MPQIDAVPGREYENGLVRLIYDITWPEDGRPPARLFYEMPEGQEKLLPPVEDGVLCALLTHAMSRGLDLRVHGPVSRDILLNLAEYQLAWRQWRPNLKAVRMEADEIADVPPSASRKTIVAFSGGVDATFSLARHARPEAGALGQDVGAIATIHGFDVGLANPRAFERIMDKSKRIAEWAGVEALWVRTNSKTLRLQKWEDSCGLELAACLHLLSGRYPRALVGSTEPYNAMVLPWGSNPVTDHLMSGGRMRMIHDGAGFTRTEKIERLAKDPILVEDLRVCWAGEEQDRNCGRCEKCLRTKLNFLAVGVRNPPCFDAPLDRSEIEQIRIRNPIQMGELSSIIAYADARGLQAPWLDALRDRIGRGVTRDLRVRVGPILKRLGLLPVAQRAWRTLRRRGWVR